MSINYNFDFYDIYFIEKGIYWLGKQQYIGIWRNFIISLKILGLWVGKHAEKVNHEIFLWFCMILHNAIDCEVVERELIVSSYSGFNL